MRFLIRNSIGFAVTLSLLLAPFGEATAALSPRSPFHSSALNAAVTSQAVNFPNELFLHVLPDEHRSQAVVRVFDAYAPRYFEQQHGKVPEGVQPEFQTFMNLIPSEGDVLDVGTGPGTYASAVSKVFVASGSKRLVTGIDAASSMIQIALRENSDVSQDALQFKVMRAEDIGNHFAPDSLAGIIDVGFLNFASSEKAESLLFEKYFQTLREGGVLWIYERGDKNTTRRDFQVHPRYGGEPIPFNHYELEDLAKRLEAVGFEVLHEHSGYKPHETKPEPWVYLFARRPAVNRAGHRPMVITIDGPAGAGKGTVAKLLAQRLGYLHIDSGAIYRIYTEKALREGINLDDERAIAALVRNTAVDLRPLPSGTQFLSDGVDVSERIRALEVASSVARVARHAVVHEYVFETLRQIGATQNCVIEGRQIGTVVFPHPTGPKFYLDADVQERARRRLAEFQAKDPAMTLDAVAMSISERDRMDTQRTFAPLRKPADAIFVDSTHLGINAVVDAMLERIKKPSPPENSPSPVQPDRLKEVVRVLGTDIEIREGGDASIDISRHPAPTKLDAMKDLLASTGLKPEDGIYFGNQNSSVDDRDGVLTQLKGLKVFAVDENQQNVMPDAERIGVGPQATLDELRRILNSGAPAPSFIGFDIDGTVLAVNFETGKEKLLEHRNELAEVMIEFWKRGTQLVFMSDNDSQATFKRIGEPLQSLAKEVSLDSAQQHHDLLFYASGMVTKYQMSLGRQAIAELKPDLTSGYGQLHRLPADVVQVLVKQLGGVHETADGEIQASGLIGRYYMEHFTEDREGKRLIRGALASTYPNFATFKQVTGHGNALSPKAQRRDPVADGSASQVSVVALVSRFIEGSLIPSGEADVRRQFFNDLVHVFKVRDSQSTNHPVSRFGSNLAGVIFGVLHVAAWVALVYAVNSAQPSGWGGEASFAALIYSGLSSGLLVWQGSSIKKAQDQANAIRAHGIRGPDLARQIHKLNQLKSYLETVHNISIVDESHLEKPSQVPQDVAFVVPAEAHQRIVHVDLLAFALIPTVLQNSILAHHEIIHLHGLKDSIAYTIQALTLPWDWYLYLLSKVDSVSHLDQRVTMIGRTESVRRYTYPAGPIDVTVKNPNHNYVRTSAGAISVGMSMLMRNLYPGSADYPSIIIAPQRDWVGRDGANLMQLYFSVAANFALHNRKTKILGTPDQLLRIQKYLELGNPYDLPNKAGYEQAFIDQLKREAIYLADRTTIKGNLQMAAPYPDMVELIPLTHKVTLGEVSITPQTDGTFSVTDQGHEVIQLDGNNMTELDVELPQVKPLKNIPEFGVTFLGTGGGMDADGLTSNQIVWAGQRHLLVDIGPATKSAMSALHLNPGQITDVVLTHMHEDHVAGALAYFRWHQEWHTAHGRPNAPIRLLMEPGLYSLFREQAQQILNVPLESVFPIELIPTPFYGTVSLEGRFPVEVETRPAWHGTPTAMLRITYKGRTISHSSDTTFDPIRFQHILNDQMPAHIRQDLIHHSNFVNGQTTVLSHARVDELTQWLFEPNAQGQDPDLVIYEAGSKAPADQNTSNHTTAYALSGLPVKYQKLIRTNHTAALPAEALNFPLAKPLETVVVGRLVSGWRTEGVVDNASVNNFMPILYVDELGNLHADLAMIERLPAWIQRSLLSRAMALKSRRNAQLAEGKVLPTSVLGCALYNLKEEFIAGLAQIWRMPKDLAHPDRPVPIDVLLKIAYDRKLLDPEAWLPDVRDFEGGLSKGGGPRASTRLRERKVGPYRLRLVNYRPSVPVSNSQTLWHREFLETGKRNFDFPFNWNGFYFGVDRDNPKGDWQMARLMDIDAAGRPSTIRLNRGPAARYHMMIVPNQPENQLFREQDSIEMQAFFDQFEIEDPTMILTQNELFGAASQNVKHKHIRFESETGFDRGTQTLVDADGVNIGILKRDGIWKVRFWTALGLSSRLPDFPGGVLRLRSRNSQALVSAVTKAVQAFNAQNMPCSVVERKGDVLIIPIREEYNDIIKTKKGDDNVLPPVITDSVVFKSLTRAQMEEAQSRLLFPAPEVKRIAIEVFGAATDFSASGTPHPKSDLAKKAA